MLFSLPYPLFLALVLAGGGFAIWHHWIMKRARRRAAGEPVLVCSGGAQAAFASFSRVPVRLVPCDIRAALELSASRNLYAYDAYFLVTAQKLACPLVTLDRSMRALAADLGIESREPDR